MTRDEMIDTIVGRIVQLTDITPSSARECVNNAVCAICVEPPYDYGLRPALYSAIEHRMLISLRVGADPAWRVVLDRVTRRHLDLDAIGCYPSAIRGAAIQWIVDRATKGLEP